MSFQDWEPVVFRKTNKEIQKSRSLLKTNRVSLPKNSSSKVSQALLNDDVPKLKKFSKETINIIVEKRKELKLSQKELAQKINLPVKTISDFEMNRKTYNHQLLNKLKKGLNIKNKI